MRSPVSSSSHPSPLPPQSVIFSSIALPKTTLRMAKVGIRSESPASHLQLLECFSSSSPFLTFAMCSHSLLQSHWQCSAVNPNQVSHECDQHVPGGDRFTTQTFGTRPFRIVGRLTFVVVMLFSGIALLSTVLTPSTPLSIW
jgi:hypothetical protein